MDPNNNLPGRRLVRRTTTETEYVIDDDYGLLGLDEDEQCVVVEQEFDDGDEE